MKKWSVGHKISNEKPINKGEIHVALKNPWKKWAPKYRKKKDT